MNATAVHEESGRRRRRPAAPAPGRWSGSCSCLAGTMTGISALLAAFVSPWFLLLTGFVALNQLAFASIRHCGASLVLERVFGARRCARS